MEQCLQICPRFMIENLRVLFANEKLEQVPSTVMLSALPAETPLELAFEVISDFDKVSAKSRTLLTSQFYRKFGPKNKVLEMKSKKRFGP